MISAPRMDTRFRVSGPKAKHLAAAYGTPLYVVDEATFRNRIREYRSAFQAAYPNSEITYASKANSTVALLAIAASEACYIDAASEGELRAAIFAGVPLAHCHFHGNNKGVDELEFAIAGGVGQIVVDNFREIEQIAEIFGRLGPKSQVPLILRLAPGVDPITHAKISTGQADTKFGFNIADGSAETAVERCLALALPLVGFHCHVGSQLLDPEAQRSGGELIARFAVGMKVRFGFEATYLNVGGGLGATYTDEDRPMAIEKYCRLIVEAIVSVLAGTGVNPKLAQEPGRSLIAEAGVTLYEVGVVKTVPTGKEGTRTYVCVDGGLSDNPRPALYGSRYTVERVVTDENVTGPEPIQVVTVSGRHCETDRLFENVSLPKDTVPGDILQVLSTGAYNSSMASNYNRFRRPATALIRPDGSDVLVQRRESWEELVARDIVPGDLI